MNLLDAHDLGFSYRPLKNGSILIYRYGTIVATVRGTTATKLRARLESSDPVTRQQILARITGNYKRGNENLKPGTNSL